MSLGDLAGCSVKEAKFREHCSAAARPVGQIAETRFRINSGGAMTGKWMGWLRNSLAVVGVLAVGYWLGGARAVNASSDDLEFQLTNIGEGSSLLVYQPSSKAVYVYRGATAGNSTLQCSYKYVVGAPGASIQRLNCPVGSAF
jgi:hypothetical protein